MKKIFKFSLIFLFFAQSFSAFAQLYVGSGSTLSINGSAVLYSSTHVINSGNISFNNGTLMLEGNLSDSGSFNGSSGTVVFSGANNQQVQMAAGASLNKVTLDKTSNDVFVNSALPTIQLLQLTKGKLDIGDYDLSVNSINGGNVESYVKTSGTGKLRAMVSPTNPFSFQVGNSSFNPVSIANNNSDSGDFSVRVLDEVYDQGMTGTALSRARVKRTWRIERDLDNFFPGVNFSFGWQPSDAVGITRPSLRAFRAGYWIPQNGSNTYSDSSLSYVSYFGNDTTFSIQEYYETQLQLKAFIQGYHTGNGTMAAALQNSGIAAAATESDSISVAVHNFENGEMIGNPVTSVLNTDGTCNAVLPGLAGPYYVSLHHRNALETWTAAPVIMDTVVNYDFTTAANKAYGSNQADMGGGMYALYSGDVNQDGAIESSDYYQMENDVVNILFGYVPTDLTGDGAVESTDYYLMENNIIQTIFVQKPF